MWSTGATIGSGINESVIACFKTGAGPKIETEFCSAASLYCNAQRTKQFLP